MNTTAAAGSSARVGFITQGRVARSEWTKLRSLRSTYWSLLATVVSLAGLGMLFAAIQMSRWADLAVNDPRLLELERSGFSSIDAAVGGYNIAQLALGVLGVLVISGEYATGTIRSSLMAVPRRLPVLWAKLAIFASVTFGLTLTCTLTGFFGVQAIVAGQGVDHSLGDPDAVRVVVGTALYLTVIGALGLGLGALLRNTAAAISAFVCLLFVLPAITSLLPDGLSTTIGPYLPLDAGSALASAQLAGPDHSAPWTGFAVLLAYTACIVALAAARLVRDDA